MTLREFKTLIDRIYAHGNHSDTVAVVVSGGCSGTSTVIAAHTGFDWNEGKIILVTKEPLQICVNRDTKEYRNKPIKH